MAYCCLAVGNLFILLWSLSQPLQGRDTDTMQHRCMVFLTLHYEAQLVLCNVSSHLQRFRLRLPSTGVGGIPCTYRLVCL